MTKKAFVVLGLGYGDEGKGLATDYLASQVEKPLVIRFNGGHQAGHTVTLLAGSKHVFSHFGAGTLRHVPTLWSRFCTFSPAYFLYEYDTLPVIPIIFVDKLCPVTTHYDVLFNRYQEDTRGKGRLGSCGVGFGATIRRHHTDNLCLSVEELFKPHVLRKKLSEIRSYYRQYFHSATQCNFDSFKHDTEDEQLFAYVEELAVLVNNGVIQLVDEKSILKSPKWSSHIYEGAQGILLDKEFGHQPFITQSNTTSKNALDLIKRNTDISTNDISLYYVTRSYLTRHGGGPFSKLPLEYELHNIETETNINNSYQGEFKRGFLNLNLMDYAIRSDKTFSRGINKNLLITCLDQLPTDEMYFSFEGKIDSVHFTDFYKKFLIKFNSVLYSFNPYSDAISKVEL